MKARNLFTAIPLLLILYLFGSCTPVPDRVTPSVSSPSPAKDQVLTTLIPTIMPTLTPQDTDCDGWLDTLDLCPQESAPNGLAGCLPLTPPNEPDAENPGIHLLYTLPMDPSGQLSIAGDRLILITDYQNSLLLIYDLADGTLLRSLSLPNLLNESPTLLPQGLLLKNYDQQRWRLITVDGQEILSVAEELELVLPEQNLLIGRKENSITLRSLTDPETALLTLPGRFMALDPASQQLAIANPEVCSLAVYALPTGTQTFHKILDPLDEGCRQSPQFTPDGLHLLHFSEGITTMEALQQDTASQTLPGQVVGFLSDDLLLLNQQTLTLLSPVSSQQLLLGSIGTQNFRGLSIGPEDKWLAIHLQDPALFPADHIVFLDPLSRETLLDTDADHFSIIGNQVLLWLVGGMQLSLVNTETLQHIQQFEIAPIQDVQPALNGSLLLISGQEQILDIYRLGENPSGEETHE